MTETFPVIASTMSSEALADDVLPGFGVGPVAACQFYSSGFNDTYRVKTIDGQIYYLRAYRKAWRTLSDILYELDVLNHLRAKEFPAAQPVVYQDGKFLI